MMISTETGIKGAYQDESTARSYVANRFTSLDSHAEKKG